MTDMERVGILAIVVAVALIGFNPIVGISPPDAATTEATIPDRVPVDCHCSRKTLVVGVLFLVGAGLVLAAVVSEHRTARRRTGRQVR